MTQINFDIDDGLTFAENIKAFTDAIEQLDPELATALAKELALVSADPTEGRDLALGRLFSAMGKSS